MIMKKTLYIEKYFKMDTNQALKFLLCDKTIKSMDNFEKACFFLMRTDLDSLKYFLERNLHYMQ